MPTGSPLPTTCQRQHGSARQRVWPGKIRRIAAAMSRTRRPSSGAVATAAVLMSAPAMAEQPAREAQQFEVSPFIGYRVGGSFKLTGAGQHVELDDPGSPGPAV